jgi:nucleoside-diphosphate-sugar epimerase
MKIAITGASGFIGKLLVEKHLTVGDEIHFLSRKNNSIFPLNDKIYHHIGDLSSSENLKDFLKGVDILYHCAAEIGDESKMNETNVFGTKNLLDAAKNNVVHWVQLSSVGVYGPIYEGVITEDHKYNPVYKYEKTKLQSDILLMERASNCNISFTIIRPSNVFGRSMKSQSLFQLIRTVDRRMFFFIGREGASANYLPVENLIESLYLAATHPNAKNQVYNISNWVSIETFISYISEVLRKPKPKRRISKVLLMRLGKITSLFWKSQLTLSRIEALSNRAIYSNQKIETELGYKPVITAKEAVKKLVAHYQKLK